MEPTMIYPVLFRGSLQKRKNLPRFLSNPSDAQIRPHANLAPEKFTDPGNMVLDRAFLILGLWRFVQTMTVLGILAIPCKEYGAHGEKSAAGGINVRGNWIEALIGWSHDCSARLACRTRAERNVLCACEACYKVLGCGALRLVRFKVLRGLTAPAFDFELKKIYAGCCCYHEGRRSCGLGASCYLDNCESSGVKFTPKGSM